ncbi:MAG: DUF4112 domain-containing protein [Caulobacter sp.]|nr:DUF4112 domain-containing protein [Caulobacter sp.]
MVFARTHVELHNIRKNIEQIKKLSDNVVGVGPFGIGMDAALNVLPNIGKINPGITYSALAGALLIFDGVRARASMMVLVQMFAILTIDTLAPLFGKKGAIADAFFTGHKWSADLLLKHMEETIYFEGTRREAMHSVEYRDLMSRVRAGKESRRVVFLGGDGGSDKAQDLPSIPPHG